MANTPLIVLVGGSGFLGRHVLEACLAKGWRVRVLCRQPQRFSIPPSASGEVTAVAADITQPQSLRGMFDGAAGVVNLVSILFERGAQRFESINVQGARAVAEEAVRANVPRLMHISALGIDQGNAAYATTKRLGEQAVRAVFPEAIILRPSLIIGMGDGFFGRFAPMSKFSPLLPLVGGGHTQFQPVLATDVARAIVAAMLSDNAKGQRYDIAGPEILTFRQLLQLMLSQLQRRRLLLPLPIWYANLIGMLCESLPFAPPITRDQVRMLKVNSISDGSARTLKDLGITPQPIHTVLPSILA